MPLEKSFIIDILLKNFSQLHNSDLILRGSLLTQTLVKPFFRPAQDIDFLANFPHNTPKADAFITELLEKKPLKILQNITSEDIWVENPHPGRRYHLFFEAEKQLLQLQIDIAFGDTIFPKKYYLPYTNHQGEMFEIPAALPEQMIAWKTHGLFEFWKTDTRWQLKDLYDIFLLIKTQKINAEIFDKCLDYAFEDKKTPFTVYERVLNNQFGQSRKTQKKWEKFVEQFENKIMAKDLQEIVGEVRNFLDVYFLKKMQNA